MVRKKFCGLRTDKESFLAGAVGFSNVHAVCFEEDASRVIPEHWLVAQSHVNGTYSIFSITDEQRIELRKTGAWGNLGTPVAEGIDANSLERKYLELAFNLGYLQSPPAKLVGPAVSDYRPVNSLPTSA